jgi:LysM repeat protein
MKTIKDIIELYKPKSADEDRFVKKHVIKKTEDANGNKDDVFNATNVKSTERTPKHGYNPGEDEQVYEGYEEIRFDDPENNSKPSGSTRDSRSRSERIDAEMNKLGNQYGRKNLASKIKKKYSPKNEETVSEDTHSDHFKFLLPLQKAGVPAPSKERAMDLIAKHGDPLRAGKAYVDRYKKIKNAANKVQKEEIELDEARTKKSPIEKLFNRPSMQFAKKYTNKKSADEIKMERLGFPARHLPKEDSDTGTTSSLEGKAKQEKIEDVAKRTMQNNSYESEGQQLNELGYEQNVSGRRRPGSPMDSAQIKRNSTLRRADAESPLKPSDIPIGKNAPVRPTVASSSSPVASPAPALTPSVPKPLSLVRSIAAAPAAATAPSVRPTVAQGGRGGPSQTSAATAPSVRPTVAAPAAKPVSLYKGTSATQNLAKLNNIKDVNKISVGQKINLGGDKSYTVQKGDTLDRISKRAAAPAAATAPKLNIDTDAIVQTVRNAGAGADSPVIRSAASISSGQNPRNSTNSLISGRGNHPVNLSGVTSAISSPLKKQRPSSTTTYTSGGINSSYEPEGDQFNELVLNPFLRGLLEATCKECGKTYKKGGSCSCCMKEDSQIDELFGIGDTIGRAYDAVERGENKFFTAGERFMNKIKTKSRTMDQQAAAARQGDSVNSPYISNDSSRDIARLRTKDISKEPLTKVPSPQRKLIQPPNFTPGAPNSLSAIKPQKPLSTVLQNPSTKVKSGILPTRMKEDVQLDEILTPSMGAGAYIDDFVNSKNPKFAGKSKEKRRQMALAAYYAAKRGN